MSVRSAQQKRAAKAQYLSLKRKNQPVNLRELAQRVGVAYSTIRKWKSEGQWDAVVDPSKKKPAAPPGDTSTADPPKKKPGAPFGNKNSAGHRNAAGPHDGAPPRNKNALKDGAYSMVFLDELTDQEQQVVDQSPTDSRKVWLQEMEILKVREYRILTAIARYEAAAENELYLTNATKITGGKTGEMSYENQDSAFSRILKLQDALYKVQGRIAKIAESLQAKEENDRRLTLEQKRLKLLQMRTTGVVDTGLPSDGDSLEIPPDVQIEDVL